MTTQTFTPASAVTLTDTAARHLTRELRKNPDKQGLRLFLKPAGCSGYKYETELCDGPGNEDEVFIVQDDLRIFIPRKDLLHLSGTVIDLVTVGLNSSLQFSNPNVQGACGCGESISFTTPA